MAVRAGNMSQISAFPATVGTGMAAPLGVLTDLLVVMTETVLQPIIPVIVYLCD